MKTFARSEIERRARAFLERARRLNDGADGNCEVSQQELDRIVQREVRETIRQIVQAGGRVTSD